MPAIPFGQLLVNNALPPQYRDYKRVLDGKGMESLLSDIAANHPDLYADTAQRLSDVGREVDYLEGDTLTLDDNISPIERKSLFKHVRDQMRSIQSSGMSDKEKEDAIEGVFSEVQKGILSEAVAQGKAKGNRYAMQIAAKARGNPLQMAAITTTPSYYRDASGKIIPLFIERSYAEGLRPHEYWASTYGARSGIVSVKFSTREGGDMAKQLTVAGGGLVVTEDNCGTLNGVPVPANDLDNMGAVLAKAYGPYKAGTPIDKSVHAYLDKTKGDDEILVRSPMTCQARTGVCKHCAGVRETGKLPDIGYNLGIVSGSAIAEQIAQGALQAKHTCLVVDTEVFMEDLSTKKIQEIVPGDIVIGSDCEGNTKPVKVLRTFNNGERDCWRTEFSAGNYKERIYLDSTLEHKVLALKQVYNHTEESLNNTPRVLPLHTKAKQFSCISVGKPKKNSLYQRMHRKKQTHLGMLPTYDIEVDHPDHLFVLANGLIVSNSGQKIKGTAQYTGFPVMEQMMQVPKSFPNRAVVAEKDGQVSNIAPAPQGGWYIDVDGHQHYTEKEPSIKTGATVEAGDVLSEGLVNPADVVRLKGIGEGRRYFANNITKIMKDSGWSVNRRNSEAVSRAMIDNVNVQDFDDVGDYLPGDRISYNNLLYSYRPRKDARTMALNAACGKFIEQPVLHYSIGTRVTNSVLGTLKKHGVQSVVAHDDPPAFEPEMIRLRAVPYSDRDWLAKLWSSNLKDNLLKDVAAGASTNLQGTHPIPRLVEGTRLDEGLYTPPKVKV